MNKMCVRDAGPETNFYNSRTSESGFKMSFGKSIFTYKNQVECDERE